MSFKCDCAKARSWAHHHQIQGEKSPSEMVLEGERRFGDKVVTEVARRLTK